jgi:ATP-dependent RNA helicase RhlE
MTFKELNLSGAILKALDEKGYTNPTPIQQQAIPHILEGKDIVGLAATGSGKTAAFCIPLLEGAVRAKTHNNGIRSLVLTPTRELAAQVYENLSFYGKHLRVRTSVIFGGVSQFNQVRELRSGVEILVATPGRLLDLIDQRIISLKNLEVLVLDEADRMLDMGFIHDIKRLIKLMPATRQNLFFSATMPSDVQALATGILKNPVAVRSEEKTVKPKINQSVYFVPRESKRALLKHVINEHAMRNVIVFARTKYGADKIAKDLNKSGISAEAFHGDKSQQARQRALGNFKRNATRVLVATDIAARGIDIVDLPFVINYELPQTADTYTHRIGRTGRAGKEGWALSFCDTEEKAQLTNINRANSVRLTVVEHPFN